MDCLDSVAIHSCVLLIVVSGEVYLRIGDAFYRPLPLSRGGRFRKVSISVNVGNVCWDEKSWPVWRGGRFGEGAVSRCSAVIVSFI